jgi:poly(A) polymerase
MSKVVIDMSAKVGGRIVQPANSCASIEPPTTLELSFDASLSTYIKDNIPLESNDGIQCRERALNRLGKLSREWIQHVCQKKGLPTDVAQMAGGQLFTSGSYRLGVHEPGADIDTILVAPNMCTREDFFGEIMENDKRDPQSLAERIRRHPDVSNFVPVEGAAVPLLTFDWEGVNIDFLFARTVTASVPPTFDIDNDNVLDGVDGATEKSLNGPRVTNLIAKLVSGTLERYQTFLTVVRCVRKWCKARGLYSNKMGYWGGVNINIAVALCVQLYPLDCPAALLRKFFLVLGHVWPWPKPMMLTKPHDAGYGLTVWSPQHNPRNSHAPIITPAYPAMNSSLSMSRQTLQIMTGEFRRAFSIIDQLWKDHQQSPAKPMDWSRLFAPSDFFIEYPNYLSLCVVAPTKTDAQTWKMFCESRLRVLVSNMLGRSLPLKKIQLWNKEIKACIADRGALLTKAQRENSATYFVGFQIDKLRMRGKELNIEQQLQNFSQWELSKFQPLVPGMDLVAKSFRAKELPKVCFLDGNKEIAMKRRRSLRNADPRLQKRRYERELQLKKAKLSEIIAKKAMIENENVSVSKGEGKRKREEDSIHDDEEIRIKEELEELIVKEERVEADAPSAGTSDDASFVEASEEVNLFQNIFDPSQDISGGKTREEAEANRRKLLAGELMDDGDDDMIDQDEDEDDVLIYSGDSARDTFMVPRIKKKQHNNKRSLPVGKEEIDILRKLGINIVSDDEQKVVGGNMVQLWRQQSQENTIESAKIQFNTKWDIVELDANGHIVDKGDADFSPSPKWTGRLAGFEFKLGERGLGYYRTGKKVVVPSNTAY